MNITIIDISNFNVKLKATIQASGKLGFTMDTAKTLALSEETYVLFARDTEEDLLYMVLSKEAKDNSFKMMKSGSYYYLPTKLMFDAFNYDYRNNVIMFDLVRIYSLDAQLGGQVYKMSRREKVRKNMER